MEAVLTVQVMHGDEAAVWVATSDDVPGLVTEAPTLERLAAKVRIMIPELLDESGCSNGDDVPCHA